MRWTFKSKTSSKEPKNLKQISNCQGKAQQPKVSSHTDHFNTLLIMQRDPKCLIKLSPSQINHVFVLLKQITDIENFCCKESETTVLAVDTSSNLCVWITDPSYQSKRILNAECGENLVNLGPIMLYFTKEENMFTFRIRHTCVQS